MIDYLTKENLCLINAETIERHGGRYLKPLNLLNANSLVYLLEAVKSEMYGESLYPALWDKAGIYMHSIISNHVFNDGNKRTGLEAAIIFLRLNGHRFDYDLSHDEIYNFTMGVASGELSLKETQEWFKANIIHPG